METRGQVTSRDEKTAIILALLGLTQAVMSVRQMVLEAKNQNDTLLSENFNQSLDEISKVHDQIDRLIKTLNQDA